MGRQMPPHAVGRQALGCERRVGEHVLMYGAANASPRSGEVGARLRAPGGESTYLCMGRQMPPHAVGRSALACERRVGRVRTNQVCGPPYVWGGKCLPTQWGGRRSLASAGWGEPRTNQVCGPPYVGGVKCLPTQWGGRRSLASAGWGEPRTNQVCGPPYVGGVK